MQHCGCTLIHRWRVAPVLPCLLRPSADRHHGPTHNYHIRFVSRLKYMRLSVPNIPATVLSKAAQHKSKSVSSSEAIERIASFLSEGHAAVLTGAGVSVDSGLKAYRGKDGRYTNPDYECAHHLTRHVPHSLSLTLDLFTSRAVPVGLSGLFLWVLNRL